VNGSGELPDDLTGTVAVTAGASAPEALVQDVVDFLAPRQGVEVVQAMVEEEYFPPPPELRELLRAIGTTVAVMVGGAAGEILDPLEADRQTSAARVLGLPEELAGTPGR
jgi:4-hydroxy-3-methylbut-2-en-1-yl diphosphate reductase